MSRIETERTYLRRLEMSDLFKMIQLESDAEVMRFTRPRVPQTLEQTETRLRLIIENQPSRDPLGVWVAELKSNADFVGWFMLMNTDTNVPELGFMLVKKHWGSGLATEIAKALVDYGISAAGLSVIKALTDVSNVASQSVLIKLGFEFQSTQTRNDDILKTQVEIKLFEFRQKS